MADDTDQLRASRGGSPTDPHGLSWPLVERRRANRTPPAGIERRHQRAANDLMVPTLAAAPLWPFRIAALVGALVRAVPDLSWHNWSLGVIVVVAAISTVVACIRPAPYRNDQNVRMRIVVEQALNTAFVMLSGAWASPFVLFFVPTGLLAGFASGAVFSAYASAAAVAVVTVQHTANVGTRPGLQDGALWAALLGLVAFTSGLAHRAALDAARQQQVAYDRVSKLAEANSLLFALQRVAQTLPASLDLDDVLDSTIGRMRTMVRHDALTVFVADTTTQRMVPARSHGIELPRAFALDKLPHGMQTAMASPKTVRIDRLPAGEGVSPAARSGLYAALSARGSLIGMIAVESNSESGFGQQDAEVVHGLTEPFGIAIDNARMFLRIRTLAADEERSRIARDLHDHVGSSLAMIGFEVDRAISMTGESDVTPVLRELREQISAVVTDVRDTLYDLRTDVTETRSLASTTADFLERVQQRSGILTHCDIRLDERLPLIVERELWQIVREAIVNAERHAEPQHIMVAARRTGDTVTLTVRDDGVGLDAKTPRPDSYGLVGMRERAHRLDAALTVRSLDNGDGTEMRIEFQRETSS